MAEMQAKGEVVYEVMSRRCDECLTGECTHRETSHYSIEDGNDVDSGFTCNKCKVDTYGKTRTWAAYTANTDAVLALIKRVGPDTLRPALIQSPDKTWEGAILRAEPDDGECPVVNAPTPALALLLAFLSALEAEDPQP